MPHIALALHPSLLAPHHLSGPFPPRSGDLLFAGESKLAGRCIADDGRAGAYGGPLADGHRSDELHVGTDVHIIFDHGAVLVRAVVIAGDRAGTDVDVASNGGIADVGEVICFGARADLARLDFDEVADVHFIRKPRAGPDTGIRSDAAGATDYSAVDVGKRFDAGSRSDFHILQDAVGAD